MPTYRDLQGYECWTVRGPRCDSHVHLESEPRRKRSTNQGRTLCNAVAARMARTELYPTCPICCARIGLEPYQKPSESKVGKKAITLVLSNNDSRLYQILKQTMETLQNRTLSDAEVVRRAVLACGKLAESKQNLQVSTEVDSANEK